MPPLRSARTRKLPPEGFDDLEDTLLEFANRMKDAGAASHEGKKRHEMVWPVFQITHQRMCLCLYFDPLPISSLPGKGATVVVCLLCWCMRWCADRE